MQLRTFVEAKINGKLVTAVGGGIWDVGTGVSSSLLRFSGEDMVDFTPSYGNCWQCNNHAVLPHVPGDGQNFFGSILDGGYNIRILTLVSFDFLGEQQIDVTLSRSDFGVQTTRQKRVGSYTGPSSIKGQLPYREDVYPDGPGRCYSEYYREIVSERGKRVRIKYRTVRRFPSKFTLPRVLRINYEAESSYDNDTGEYRLAMKPTAKWVASVPAFWQVAICRKPLVPVFAM